ncbi:MAG: response regulator transcription factor [Clostridiaceae bacterium]|nr:response regulator transcription factor [Clostridiaceae bacterium]
MTSGGEIVFETPLRIAVCEDTPEEAKLLLRYISESGVTTDCQHFSSCEALIANFIPGLYDLIFLDIYMGNVQQGIDAAAKIRETDAMVTLAFTTYSEEHALEGYRLKAIAYLEKPVQSDDVREVIEHAANKRKNAPAIELPIGGKSQEIPLQTIMYFEHKNRSVFVNTLSDVFRTSQTVSLKDIQPQLPIGFFRCHQSYIANLRYVKELDRELRLFRMQNGDPVYIRRSSLGKAIKAYERQLFATAREGIYEKIY